MHSARLRFFIVALFAVAAWPAAAQDAGDRLMVPNQRVGAILKTTKPADLPGIFGAANVRIGKIQGPEGDEPPGAMVYEGKPDELKIYFTEDAKRIAYIVSEQKGSTWRTAAGVRIGMPLAEVEKLNGGPFVMSGFEWDLGGMLIDNPKGKLPKGLTLAFNPTRQLPERESNQIVGDKRISSAHPIMRKAAPEVTAVGVHLGR